MNEIGCTTPYGLNISKLCRDEKQVQKSLQILRRVMRNHSCDYPCDFLSNFSVNQVKGDILGTHFINLKEFIEKRESTFTYGWVDLFAALGGYLGSFLGVSLLHISDGFTFLLRKTIKIS